MKKHMLQVKSSKREMFLDAIDEAEEHGDILEDKVFF